MDFLNFVNSNAVRSYLQEIRYQPTSLEAAWLVYQCETASLEEKCAAWREIIETLPDCPTGSRTRGLKPEHRDSVHTFLQAYIEQQETLATAFMQADDPAVYKVQCQLLPKGERFWRQWRRIDEEVSTREFSYSGGVSTGSAPGRGRSQENHGKQVQRRRRFSDGGRISAGLPDCVCTAQTGFSICYKHEGERVGRVYRRALPRWAFSADTEFSVAISSR